MSARSEAIREAALIGLSEWQETEYQMSLLEDGLSPSAKTFLLELREKIDILERAYAAHLDY